MSFRDDIAGVLEEFEDALAFGGEVQTFTWKGAEIPCVPDQLNRGAVVVSGGHELTVGFTLRVRRDNFQSADDTLTTVDSELVTMDSNVPHPVAGRTLTFRGKSYKILTATEDSSRAYYKLDLGDRNSGK